MNGRIAKLSVWLGLDKKDLEKGLASSQAKLRSFGRAMSIAGAAAGAAAATGLAAITSESLRTIDVQAKLARDLGTTTASVQVMDRAGSLAGVSLDGIAQATKDLTRRLSQAADGGGPAAKALERLGFSAEELMALPLDQRIAAINEAIERFVPAAARAAVAGQLFGEEGSIAMSRIDTATLRKATEDVERFGLAVSEQDAAQIQKTNDALSRMALAATGVGNQIAISVAPALERIADWLATATEQGSVFSVAMNALAANLDRIFVYAGVTAAVFGGAYVAGLVKAAAVTVAMSGSLVTLRRALIKTGIGALIVGAGELVVWFGRLRTATGDTGSAFGLMSDVAAEVFQRIIYASQALGFRLMSDWQGIKATVFEVLQSAVEAHFDFAATVGGVVRGVVEGFKAGFGVLPQALAGIMVNVSNSIIDKVNQLFARFTAGLDRFIGTINDRLGTNLSTIGGGNLFERIGGGEAGSREAGVSVGDAFAEGFRGAVESIPLGNAPDLFGGVAAELRGNESLLDGVADIFGEGARAPIASLETLRQTLSEVGDETTAVTPSLEAMNDELNAVGGGSGGGGSAQQATSGLDDVGKAADGVADRVGRVRDVFGNAFESIIDRSKSVKGAIGSILSEFAKLTRQRLFGQLFDAGVAKGGLFASLVGSLAGSIPGNANGTPYFEGGLTRLHERGDEIYDLPRGTRIYPHQVSMQMAKSAGKVGAGRDLNINISLEGANGDEAIARTAEAAVMRGINDLRHEMPELVNRISSDPRRR